VRSQEGWRCELWAGRIDGAVKSRDTRRLPLPSGAGAAQRTIIDYVSDRSAALVLAPAADHVFIGSAVCIRIEDRYLAATAAHNLEDITSLDQIRVLPCGERGRGHSSVVGYRVSSERDLAALEIDASYAKFSTLRFLGPGDLVCGQRHHAEQSFLLQGYPRREAAVHSPDDIEPLSLGLITCSVPPAKVGDFLAVEYPPQAEDDAGLELVEPSGISGGGVWLFPSFEKNRLWAPEKARLVAIATSWIEAKHQEVAEPIEFWLQLVVTEFPELAEAIAGVNSVA
jgi:hypothetical protein